MASGQLPDDLQLLRRRAATIGERKAFHAFIAPDGAVTSATTVPEPGAPPGRMKFSSGPTASFNSSM